MTTKKDTPKENTKALQRNAKVAMTELREYLERNHQALARVCPTYLNPERMVRLTLGVAARNPALLRCTPKSWLLALMDCGFYGLEPNPVLGHAYFVPFRNKHNNDREEIQFMAGYKGLILLAMKTGALMDIDASMIYENDRFREQRHREPPFIHVPTRLGEDRGKKIGVYAYARLVTRATKVRVLSVKDVEVFRDRSRAKNSGPWRSDWDAMAMKTATRRLMSYLPIEPGSKIAAAVSQETANEAGDNAHAGDWIVPGETPTDAADDLAATLERAADDESHSELFSP